MRNIEQHQARFPDLTEQEKKEGKERFKEFVETIEKDLYPERYNKGSAWIWILVIAGIVIVGGLIG